MTCCATCALGSGMQPYTHALVPCVHRVRAARGNLPSTRGLNVTKHVTYLWCLATPLCDIPSGWCFFTGPWTVTRSSLRMLRRVAAFRPPRLMRRTVKALPMTGTTPVVLTRALFARTVERQAAKQSIIEAQTA